MCRDTGGPIDNYVGPYSDGAISSVPHAGLSFTDTEMHRFCVHPGPGASLLSTGTRGYRDIAAVSQYDIPVRVPERKQGEFRVYTLMSNWETVAVSMQLHAPIGNET